MRSFPRFVPLALVVVLLPMLFGCGGGEAVPPSPAPVVAVAIAEDSVSLSAGETYQFTAAVTGHSNTAVSWSLSGCTGAACGTIAPTGFYTAPSVIPTEATVTVTATSQADPTKFDTVAVHHMPIAVSIAPPGATVIPGATLSFTVVVQHDINNAGVTWALGPACFNATCGTLSNVTPSSVTYTSPATVPNPPTVTLTATSITDPSKTAGVNITVSVFQALTEGDYGFFFNGWEIHYSQQWYTPSRVAVAGHFHADSSGHITDGVEDINLASGVSQSVPFTGAYSLGTDRRGSFTITTAQETATYRMTVDASGSKGKFIKFDAAPIGAPISGTGYFELQDKAAFSLSALAGPYAMGMFGTVEEANRIAAVGGFTASTAGALSSGKMDVTVATHAGQDPQASFTNLTLTGSFSSPSSSTGRGTATVTLTPPPDGAAGTFNFVYYIISDQKILLVQNDTRSSTMPVLSGEVRRQNGSFSATSFHGPAIFSMTGVNRANYGAEIVHAAVGQMVPDGSGSVTGIIDDNGGQYPGTPNKAFTGSYSVDPGGRSTMALQLAPGNTDSEIAYFFGPNEAFLMQTSGTDVLFGSLKPQAAGPFTAASVAGTFPTATAAPASEEAENDCGLTTFDGGSAVTSTMDVNVWDSLHHFDFTGTYAVAANGRGTLTFTSPPPDRPIVFWIISPTELVGMGAVDPSSLWSALLEYGK